jgi:hypothetical protein
MGSLAMRNAALIRRFSRKLSSSVRRSPIALMPSIAAGRAHPSRAFPVRAHQPRIADDIGGSPQGRPSHSFFRHARLAQAVHVDGEEFRRERRRRRNQGP